MRMIVQKVGLEMFNDGLRQSLRLSYQEYEEQTSGESVALLQKVRTDIERFVNALINIFFSSVVGVAFLVWYAVTRHWLLIPVFVFGVLVLGASPACSVKKSNPRSGPSFDKRQKFLAPCQSRSAISNW